MSADSGGLSGLTCLFSRRPFPITVGVLAAISWCHLASADTINQNHIKWHDPTGNNRTATDFTMRLDTGVLFTKQPEATSDSQKWNSTNAVNQNSVTFSGVPLTNDSSVNVTYQIAESGSGKPVTTEFSFNDGPPQTLAVHSQDATLKDLSFVPTGTGFTVTLDIVNDFDTALAGTLNLYVNTGFPDFFNFNDYATLRNATQVFSSSYSLAPGEGFFGLAADLPTTSDYLLLIGTADSGDGLGPLPFSQAISSVPEPGSLSLLSVGVFALIGSWWLRRKTVYTS
jgi:hypothetical protein